MESIRCPVCHAYACQGGSNMVRHLMSEHSKTTEQANDMVDKIYDEIEKRIERERHARY